MRALYLTAAIAVFSLAATAQDRPRASNSHDDFYWLGEFNKASAVMTVEQGIVPKPLGKVIAEATDKVAQDGAKPGGARPSDYLQYERLVVAYSGPDVTSVHSERRRQATTAP